MALHSVRRDSKALPTRQPQAVTAKRIGTCRLDCVALVRALRTRSSSSPVTLGISVRCSRGGLSRALRFLRRLQVAEETAVGRVEIVQELTRLIFRQFVRRAHGVQGDQPLSCLADTFVVVRQAINLVPCTKGGIVRYTAKCVL